MHAARPFAASALLLWLVFAAVAEAAESPRESAVTLTTAALAERRRADALAEGWAEAYDKGIALAGQAVAADPSYAEAYYAMFLNVGLRARRAGIAAQAVNVRRLKELLDKTIALDPCHADAWEARGEMLMQLPWVLGGSQAKGEQALQRSAECDPGWAKPALRLAEAHWKKGDGAGARAEAERARELASARGDDDLRQEAEALLREISVAASRR
jgi:hypothetical protein